jgi:simple sugar transport system ATP-binding protein
MVEPALELRGVDMHYGYVRALDAIDIQVRPGEVLGLLGDNGAGKSSLLKVMSGAHQPTSGTILVHGVETVFGSPSDSTRAGIQMVYQDLALVEAQDIATNLHIGREILRKGLFGWLGFVDHKAQRKRSETELAALGVRTAAVTRPVEMLSGGQRHEQTQQVQALIRRMAEQGIACVLVTHNLPLAMDVCDRIGVLNRGRIVADVATSETDNDQLVGWITGARPSMFG